MITNAAQPARPSAYEMRRVETRVQWEELRSLRYRALRSRNDIPEDPDGFPDDGYDGALNTITFLLTRRGRGAGCTRSSVSSSIRRRPLPAIESFRREIETAIGWEATIVEASHTLLDPDLQGDPHDALIHLFKAQMLRCSLEKADWLVTAVPEPQIGFYRRAFNMDILSGSERYPRVATPRVLMGLDYGRTSATVFKRIPALAIRDSDTREFLANGNVVFGEEPEQRVA